MKPKEIIEKEKLGYTELTKEQIKEYVKYEIVFDYFKIVSSVGFPFRFRETYDTEVKKKFLGLCNEDIISSDVYYINDELEVFFKGKVYFDDILKEKRRKDEEEYKKNREENIKKIKSKIK